MAGTFRIEDLHPDIQRVFRPLDSGADGVPDGRVTEADLPNIDAALARIGNTGDERAKQDAALLRSLRPATRDGLAMPRPDQAGVRVQSAIASRPHPGDAIQALDNQDLRVATIGERVEMITHITRGTGYDGWFGWWEGRVNNPREQKILEIMNSTPEHQRGALVNALYDAPNLIADMNSAIDGAEYRQFRAFLQQNMWEIPTAGQMAHVLHQIGGIRSDAELITMARQLRDNRGDAFADDVLTQLVAMQDVQGVLPYVFWSVPSPDCESGSDILATAAYRGMIEMSTQQHRTHLNNLLQAFPPNGAAAQMLRSEFDQRHNLQRIMAGVDIAACVAGYLMRQREAADERARETRGQLPSGPVSGTGLPSSTPAQPRPRVRSSQQGQATNKRVEPKAPRSFAQPSGRNTNPIKTGSRKKDD